MTILIIDDQKKVVDGIRAEMNWAEFDIEKIYGAYSAREAREIILANHIDIMISDIEMPEEDGLSLYAWVKAHKYDINCIFLTAHADFSYAREALSLGSVDYILQPARQEEIADALRRAIAEREQRLRLKELEKKQILIKENVDVLIDKAFEQILNQEIVLAKDTDSHIHNLCHKTYQKELFYLFGIEIMRWVKPEWENKLVRMVFKNVLGELFEPYDCEVLIGGFSNQEYVVLVHGDALTLTERDILAQIETMHSFIQRELDFRIAVYISGTTERDILMHTALKKIGLLKENNVMRREEIMSDWSKKEWKKEELHVLHIEHWENLLEEGSGCVIKSGLEKFFEKNVEELNVKLIKILHMEYTKALFEAINKKNQSAEFFFTEEYTYDDFAGAWSSCQAFLRGIDYTVRCLNIEGGENEEKRIACVKKYVSENISKNITRAEVAQQLYLTEEYFSRWFSKQMGCSFKNYVMEQKINFAKQLLENTGFHVGIIASKIGCDNYSYFSKMFKKTTGMTPQEYRALNQKE